jgi:hypothetical protein
MAASCGSSYVSWSGVSIRKKKNNKIFHEEIFPPLTFERICNIHPEKTITVFLSSFLDPDPYLIGSPDSIREDRNYPQ